MRNVVASVVLLLLLSSCAYQITLMPRDSGKTYSGTMEGSGGSGTATITIGSTTYTGPAVRVASNDTFGFASVYGSNSRGTSASAYGTSYSAGDKYVKAILSSPDGRGLRCDFVGRGRTGGGICVDDNKTVYDVVIVMK